MCRRKKQSARRGRGRKKRHVLRPIARRPRRPARRRGGATPRRRPPYLQLLERRGPVSVWLVDGAYVRKNIDEEVSNFRHHYSYGEIPKGQGWPAHDNRPDAQRVFLAPAPP